MPKEPCKVSPIGYPVPEAVTLLNHLAANYPLPCRAIVKFVRRNGLQFMGSKCINGKAWFVDHVVQRAKRYELRVYVGKQASPRPTREILKTLCHEYKHALQYAAGTALDCKEADRFAWNEVSRYLTRTTGVPYALPCNLVPNFVPPVSHLREILHHLSVNYPLYKTIKVEFIRKNSLKHPTAKHCNGQMIVTDEAYNLQVTIGTAKKPRNGLGILHTTMHEYQHAIQHSEGRPYDCDEADKFAVKILYEVAGDPFKKEGTGVPSD